MSSSFLLLLPLCAIRYGIYEADSKSSLRPGYVPAWAAVPFGVCGAAFANYGTKLKFLLRIDDALDIFAVHGVGGLVGNVLTAFFAADYIAHLDGVTEIPGGFLNHNYIQLGYQLADSVSGGAYSFILTTAILFIMNLIPGLHLRASEEAEILGIDDAEIGEFGKRTQFLCLHLCRAYGGE